MESPLEVSFTSPGLPPSRMDDQGRLVEDWGTVAVTLAGAGLPANAPATVASLKLEGLIPAAQAESRYGGVALTVTAFRAPVWPGRHPERGFERHRQRSDWSPWHRVGPGQVLIVSG